MAFRVDLEIFRGPLDLLLYLVRKHEVEIVDIPVGLIADQFVQHMDVLQSMDVNAAGDFLQMASTLTEMKSRMVLPRADEVEEDLEDPRQDLVRQLLEYKKFKDAASLLDEQSRSWQERFPRLANESPTRERDLAEEPIHEVELWDLVSAFGRVIRDQKVEPESNITYDDTPIHVYISRIHDTLREQGQVAFSELFQPNMHKSTLVGIFLAILELIRHHGVKAEQDKIFGEIWVRRMAESEEALDLSQVDDYLPAAHASQSPDDASSQQRAPSGNAAETSAEESPASRNEAVENAAAETSAVDDEASDDVSDKPETV
jgi:segregation and condensation protein A